MKLCFLDKVDALGIGDDTYIVFLSDNGAVPWIPPIPKMLMAHPGELRGGSRNEPLRSGKWTLYEGGLRVPFIVSGPRVEPGSLCRVPVAGWDLLSTLSDLAGNTEPLPDDLDGGSLRALLEHGGNGEVDRPTEGLVFHSPFTDPPHSAIRWGDHKLVERWETDDLELYDLTRDVGETENLAGTLPDRTEALHRRLMEYMVDVGAEIPAGG